MFSREGNQQVIPNSYNLGEIYKHFFQEEIQNAHTAKADVDALLKILQHKDVWKHRFSW